MMTYPALTKEELRRLGKSMREWRVHRNLSIDVVAARAGISRLTLLHLERGASNPRLDTLEKVAHALDGKISFEVYPLPEDLGDAS